MFQPRGFFFFLDREIAAAERYGHYLGFLLFRVKNSSKSPAEKLQRLAESLAKNIRKTDYLGAVDDHTFGVVLLNTTVDHAEAVSNRLHAESIYHLLSDPKHYELKVGSAVYPTEANSIDSLKNLAKSRLDQPSN